MECKFIGPLPRGVDKEPTSSYLARKTSNQVPLSSTLKHHLHFERRN